VTGKPLILPALALAAGLPLAAAAVESSSRPPLRPEGVAADAAPADTDASAAEDETGTEDETGETGAAAPETPDTDRAAAPQDDAPAGDAAGDDGDDAASDDASSDLRAPLLPSVPQRIAEDDAAFAACLGELDDLGATYELVELPVTGDNPDCGIALPLRLQQIAPGIALEPAGLLRCETALAAAEWMQEEVLPAIDRLERGALEAVEQGGAYVCRARTGGGGEAGLSEHAFGNALDIMAFRFEDGSRLGITPRAGDGDPEEGVQRAVRGGACLSFTTVLGPGSNAAHDDHLHLDVKTRRGGWRLCE